MKITQHGNRVADKSYDFKCNQCGCEFTVEKGDKFYHVDITNPVRSRNRRDAGRIIHHLRTQYDSSDCPECGTGCAINYFTQEIAP